MADSKRVLVPIADGSEEIETACITDTLVRAGATVIVASVSESLEVKMSRGLRIVAEKSIEDAAKDVEASGAYDAIALPGGLPGAEHLRDCAILKTMLEEQVKSGKIAAAVCASPAVVFGSHGLLPSKATCYPAPKFKDAVPMWDDSLAIMDGNIITSQGPGTSLQFALKIVEALYGKEKAEEIAKAMLTSTA
mmetsp:Transcript_44006/g.121767  ORF Transcript_44006/g.121767 Transcript_44006/m.121767 type:complete len:193 (-) Transcript_44006:95-673(-)